MTGSKENLDQKEKRQRSGWNEKLMNALHDKNALAQASQIARNEIISTEYLSRPFRQSTAISTKMAGAGDEDIGL